jgi:uncharacterized protein YbcI
MHDEADRTLEDAREHIANEVLDVHRESYGTGAGNVTVHIAEDVVFVVLDDLELTTLEQTLLEGDNAEAVQTTRSAYQHAIQATFAAIIERATGRRVTSFLSNTSVESRYSVEVFRLATSGG